MVFCGRERKTSQEKGSPSNSSSEDESNIRTDAKARHIPGESARLGADSTDEAEELREFRRQAEIQKIRDEVLRSMPSQPSKTKLDKVEADKGVEGESFTPKTKTLLQAQSRILTPEGVCKRIWEDVYVQLNSSLAADIKTLCGQLCAQTPRTKGECISKIVDALQDRDCKHGAGLSGLPRSAGRACKDSLAATWVQSIQLRTKVWLCLCLFCGISVFLGYGFGFM